MAHYTFYVMTILALTCRVRNQSTLGDGVWDKDVMMQKLLDLEIQLKQVGDQCVHAADMIPT